MGGGVCISDVKKKCLPPCGHGSLGLPVCVCESVDVWHSLSRVLPSISRTFVLAEQGLDCCPCRCAAARDHSTSTMPRESSAVEIWRERHTASRTAQTRPRANRVPLPLSRTHRRQRATGAGTAAEPRRPCGRPLGNEKDAGELQGRFWWRGMTADRKSYCASCQRCRLFETQPRPTNCDGAAHNSPRQATVGIDRRRLGHSPLWPSNTQ